MPAVWVFCSPLQVRAAAALGSQPPQFALRRAPVAWNLQQHVLILQCCVVVARARYPALSQDHSHALSILLLLYSPLRLRRRPGTTKLQSLSGPATKTGTHHTHLRMLRTASRGNPCLPHGYLTMPVNTMTCQKCGTAAQASASQSLPTFTSFQQGGGCLRARSKNTWTLRAHA